MPCHDKPEYKGSDVELEWGSPKEDDLSPDEYVAMKTAEQWLKEASGEDPGKEI